MACRRKWRLWVAVVILSALSLAFSGGSRMQQRSINAVAPAADTPAFPYRIGWTQLSPKTQLSNVCPPPKYGYDFRSNCKNVIAAWSGGIADVARNRLIIWGGGHTDYYGNEVYALNVSDQTMVRLNDPGPILSPNAENASVLADGTPNSRPTYNGLAYIAHADRMFAFSGSLASNSGNSDDRTWTLDLSSMQWRAMDPVKGDKPKSAVGVVSDYDPNTRSVFLHDTSGFFQYTYETNAYVHLSDFAIDYHNSAVIDPKRKLFFIIGGQAPNTPNSNVIQVVDISRGSKYALQNWKTSGCGPLPSAGYPGVAYDPVPDRIVGWAGGNTVYIFNPDTKSCTTSSTPDGPGAPQNNGTSGRFRYFPAIDGFVLVNDANENAFVLKLSSPGGG